MRALLNNAAFDVQADDMALRGFSRSQMTSTASDARPSDKEDAFAALLPVAVMMAKADDTFLSAASVCLDLKRNAKRGKKNVSACSVGRDVSQSDDAENGNAGVCE